MDSVAAKGSKRGRHFFTEATGGTEIGKCRASRENLEIVVSAIILDGNSPV
jgi:hypothetical protein